MQTALKRIMTARLAQHRQGGHGNPYRNSIQHTAYSIQRDPRTFEFGPHNGTPGRLSSGNGDGWKPWKQLLHTSAPSLTEEQHL